MRNLKTSIKKHLTGHVKKVL